MRENNSGRPEKRHGGRIPARWLISGLLLFAALTATAAWTASKRDPNRAGEGPRPPEQKEDTLTPGTIHWELPEKITVSTGIRNVLLVGLDRPPEEDNARADSILLCSLNEDNDVLTPVSILSDTLLPVPGYGEDCISAAYSLGGVELLVKTVEQDLGLAVYGCLAADPEETGRCAAAAAPLEVYLTAEEAEELNDWGEWDLTEGFCFLDAAQILRYTGGGQSSVQRAQRQRRVMTAAFQKLSEKPVTELYTIAERELPQIDSDLSRAQVLELIFVAVGRHLRAAEGLQFPAEDTYTTAEEGVLLPDLAENGRLLRQILYG